MCDCAISPSEVGKQQSRLKLSRVPQFQPGGVPNFRGPALGGQMKSSHDISARIGASRRMSWGIKDGGRRRDGHILGSLRGRRNHTHPGVGVVGPRTVLRPRHKVIQISEVHTFSEAQAAPRGEYLEGTNRPNLSSEPTRRANLLSC